MEPGIDQSVRRRSSAERRTREDRRRITNRLFAVRARHSVAADRRQQRRGWTWFAAIRRHLPGVNNHTF
jgi:hypothetical protein